MDDFINIMEKFVKDSSNSYKVNSPGRSNNWMECYKLWKNGWQVKEYEEVKDSDNIAVKWIKDSQEKSVILTISDQIFWLEFLEKTK
jgi:hypothetical protein